jgi:preprotein translocase SecE subunit
MAAIWGRHLRPGDTRGGVKPAMAKTRAQRKAERRAREAEEQKRSGSDGKRKSDSRAQHDTQVPVSGDIAEIEAVEAGMAVGAPEADLETPDAPKGRSQRRVEAKELKQAEKRQREEQKRKEREQVAKRQKQAQAEKRQRGGVLGFFVSCWAELRKVQWPDRETLVQATAVTIIFVAVAGAYLGALDSAFSFLIKQIL